MKPLRDIFPFGPVRLELRWPTFGAQERGVPRGSSRTLGDPPWGLMDLVWADLLRTKDAATTGFWAERLVLRWVSFGSQYRDGLVRGFFL